ncbi:MAG: hypothetical protein M1457_09810 [bacterium]|nr:hypothetical protein [bacterium]
MIFVGIGFPLPAAPLDLGQVAEACSKRGRIHHLVLGNRDSKRSTIDGLKVSSARPMKLSWFYNMNPSWVVIILVAAMMLAAEIGYRFGLRRHEHAGDKGRGYFGTVLGSTLGLVALLLGFDFNLSAQRYEARRQLVISNANAINALYLHSNFLPDSHRKRFKQLLRRYVDEITNLPLRQGITEDELQSRVMQAGELYQKMWETTSDMAQESRSAKEAEALLPLLLKVGEVSHQRLFSYLGRVPGIIIGLLLGASLIAMGAVGFAGGLGQYRGVSARVMLGLLLGGTIFMILNLDQPRRGMIRIDQSPMVLVQQTVDRDPETNP